MSNRFPDPPATGTPIAAPRLLGPVRAFLATRRSGTKDMLGEPGPSPALLKDLLRVGARVPDHRRLTPWRFIVVRGKAREALGDVLAARHAMLHPDATQDALDKQRRLAFRAPVTVIVVSAPVPDDPKGTPVWEQELSAGAVCHQLCLATHAAGFAAAWLSEDMAFDAWIGARLGLKAGERIAGQVLIGTAKAASPERPRPDMDAIVTYWKG